MVFVNNESVKPKPVAKDELVDIFPVELVTPFRIETRIGDIDPLALRAIRCNVRIRHKVHEIELQLVQYRHSQPPLPGVLRPPFSYVTNHSKLSYPRKRHRQELYLLLR